MRSYTYKSIFFYFIHLFVYIFHLQKLSLKEIFYYNALENLYIFKLISKIEKIHLLYNIFQNHRNQRQWFYQKFQLLIWVKNFFLSIEYLFSITLFIVHVIIFFVSFKKNIASNIFKIIITSKNIRICKFEKFHSKKVNSGESIAHSVHPSTSNFQFSTKHIAPVPFEQKGAISFNFSTMRMKYETWEGFRGCQRGKSISDLELRLHRPGEEWLVNSEQ